MLFHVYLNDVITLLFVVEWRKLCHTSDIIVQGILTSSKRYTRCENYTVRLMRLKLDVLYTAFITRKVNNKFGKIDWSTDLDFRNNELCNKL